MTNKQLLKFLKFVPDALAAQNRSKDPSTKVGAIAIDDDFNVRASGYNGFPRGVFDDPEHYEKRELKLLKTTHAETNVVCQAARTGVSLKDCTLIVTALYPCPTCAGVIIQAGFKRVLFPAHDMPKRWATPWATSREMFNQAGVKMYRYTEDSIEEYK